MAPTWCSGDIFINKATNSIIMQQHLTYTLLYVIDSILLLVALQQQYIKKTIISQSSDIFTLLAVIIGYSLCTRAVLGGRALK